VKKNIISVFALVALITIAGAYYYQQQHKQTTTQESPDSPELLSFTSDGKVQNIMIARDAEDPAKRFTNVATVGNFKLTDPDHLELSVGPAKQVIEIKVTNETLIMVSEGTETVLQRYAP